MGINAFKVAFLMLFVATLLMVPLVYAGPVCDYDFDEGETGSWTEAEVWGWWDPPLVYNIFHDHDFDFAPGYGGVADYEYVPEDQGTDNEYGTTWVKIWVRQDSELIETVESFAMIPMS